MRGMSQLSASLKPRTEDVFEAQGLPQLQDTLVVFKRDAGRRISGLAIAPDGLHELPFRMAKE